MIVIAQVRLASHFLGELKPDNRGVRRFKTDAKNYVLVNQGAWLEDMTFAERSLKLNTKVKATVVPPPSIMPASIHLLRRVYSRVHVELFESFRKGTILSFDMQLMDDNPKCPTLDEISKILAFVGEFRGISQWGNKFGFGRFSVVGVRDRYQPETEAAQLPAADTQPGVTEQPG